MIEESATVVELDGQYAVVETIRKSTCGSCEAKTSCGTAVLSKVVGNRANRMRLRNTIHAQVGDTIILGLHERALLQTSFLFYLTPLFSCFLFALLGRFIDDGVGEVATISFSLVGLLSGLAFVKWLSIKLELDSRYQAVLLRHDVSSQVVDFNPVHSELS